LGDRATLHARATLGSIGITKLVISAGEKNGLLHKSESLYDSDSWTITTFILMEQSGFNTEQNQIRAIEY
jgi:hypothetical protein